MTVHSIDDIDRKLEAYREKLALLETRRQDAERREAALDAVPRMLDQYCQTHGLQRADLYQVLEKDIEKWIKSRRGEEEGIHQHLKSYFARVLSEGDTVVSRQAPPAEPKLPAGLYTNPYSGEQVIKKTRAPKELRQWVQRYGLGAVETWRK
ncbi:MAG: hypothetical protein LAT62_12035 [Natronospirillum sp.]|uniref:hypothetical protein n=1 Tax=Natronospirillum sp. TaxID=2812955 RepID=UPI0025CD3C6C|nr:hypothetical protein [Natronospirillum sp.]MCH8552661.1 hypothetical protein [Natronospirillum sp.]